ncbi:MFS transporter [Kitasatospora cineracea]|uniref:MFS transporter n=1 Tax=Kitasatospora cineracea TaxID=88074 RepID=UPI0037FF6B99
MSLLANWSRIGRLPRTAKLLLATNGLSAFGAGMVLPFLWIYLTRIRHFDAWVPAAALAVQAGAAIVGGLVWGALLDRLPYRRAVPYANIVAGVGTLVYGFASSPWIALVAATVWGFGINGVGTAVRAAYAACTEPDQRTTVYSADYGLLNLGMGAGVVVGGALAAADFATPAARYALLYGIDALTYLVMAAATWGALPGGVRTRAQQDGARASRPNYLSVLRRPGIAVVLVLLAMNALVTFGQFRAGLPGYLQSHSISPGGLSTVFALNIIMCAVVQFVGMPLLERVPARTLLLAAGGCATGCWALVYLSALRHGVQALLVACAAVVLLSVAESLAGPLLSTQLNEAATDEDRGRANALFSTTVSASGVIGPILAGALLPWHGGVLLVVVMVVLSAAFVLPVLRLSPRKDAAAGGVAAGGGAGAGQVQQSEPAAGAVAAAS